MLVKQTHIPEDSKVATDDKTVRHLKTWPKKVGNAFGTSSSDQNCDPRK